MPEEYVLIAKILKPHGIEGELAIKTFTHDDARFLHLEKALLRKKDGGVEEIEIESARETALGILLKFKGIVDRTAAEGLRNVEIVIPESERPQLPEGRAYFDQVIGMTVIDDETGEELGRVRNVLDMPAGDVFVLVLNGAEHLVTNAGNEIRKLDVKKKQLRVKLLENL